MQQPTAKYSYEFDGFRLDVSEKNLSRDAAVIPLTPKVFDTLQIFVENAGRLLEKEFLMQEIWRGSFVEENSLASNIKTLRKVLGDSASEPRFIETVPRRGYRFIAEVKKISPETEVEPPPKPHLSSNEKNFAPPKTPTYPYFSIAAVSLLFIGVLTLAGWLTGAHGGKAAGSKEAVILSAPFALEKISASGKVYNAVITPDGKSAIYTNVVGDKQSVWLRQIDSGSNLEIIPQSDAVYFGLAISPDGNFLYFARRDKNVERQADIYRVSIFGGVPQKIISETQGWMSVSPDGAKISFVRCFHLRDENCSLWIADAADGQHEQKIASRPPPVRISDNRFAPDGRRIAFAAGQSRNAANDFGLFEVNLETNAERELTGKKFFNIKYLAWLPDADALLLTASKISAGNFRVWKTDVATGVAEPLSADAESYDVLSLDRNAAELVSTQVKEDFRLTLYQTENPSSPRVLTNADGIAIAPDGKIIFSSPMSGNREIWSINSDGGNQRQLTGSAADDSHPVVSADNSIFFASNRTGTVQIWRMDIDGGNPTQITKKEGGFPLTVSADGKWLYYNHGIARTLWRVPAAGGAEELVFGEAKIRFAVSPDGSQAAFPEKQDERIVVKIISLVGGNAGQTIKILPSNLSNAQIISLVWLADGKSLAYISADDDAEKNILWRQPLDGSTRTVLAVPPRKVIELTGEQVSESQGFAFAPDGKTFAVAQGSWRHDAVLIKGLKNF